MLTRWETKIVETFINRYAVSKAAYGKALRLRTLKVFPEFDAAPPDEKESFLEAAESLEKRGIFTLIWQKRRKHEALAAIDCINKGALFTLAGRTPPEILASRAREAAASYAVGINSCLFSGIANQINPRDAEHGIDEAAVHDFAKLIMQMSATKVYYGTTRALSVLLYNDSKRLEHIVNLFNKILNRVKSKGVSVPDMSFLERTFPEAFIAGKLIFTFGENEMPIENTAGSILGFPLETAQKFSGICVICNESDKYQTHNVLTVENKETFYALAYTNKYSCVLYTGGYPNKAVSLIVQLLSQCGFDFYHAGDLDPDGILILQAIQNIAQKNVTPVNMDAETFNRYIEHGRKLEPSMLSCINRINQTVRSVSGMKELIRLIETSGLGIEQEIIDYKLF
ncbi:hypothetical protein AGMMS50212_02400 [Spirochaetia bacterium]|nr:hypothetical protein AGMMS50212_02400 [Spirochaetia bacterium]